MNDVIIRYNQTYHGQYTFTPPGIEGDYPMTDLEEGGRTLEFNLFGEQELIIDMPGAWLRLKLSKDGFSTEKLIPNEFKDKHRYGPL